MFKRCIALPLLGVFVGGIFLSASPGNNNSRYNSQNVRPGVSEESYDSRDSRDSYHNYPASGREEIVYMDERDADIHHRANRKGDWGYKQNWRYDREAFYRGETQGEAYDREHPDSAGGIGMDPDPEYLQMRRFYLEQSRRNSQNNANSRNDNTRSNQRNVKTSYNRSSQSNNNNSYNYNSSREYYR